MPKVSVYIPDDLYREVRERDLPVSALAQQALRDAVAASRNDAWIARERARLDAMPDDGPDYDVSALMDEVRGEFGT